MNAQLGEVVAAHRDGTYLFRLSGEFDLSNAWQIRDVLLEAIHTGDGDIVVDLVRVRFLDAQLLHSLLRAQAAAARLEIGFVIVPPRDPGVWRVARLVDFPLAA